MQRPRGVQIAKAVTGIGIGNAEFDQGAGKKYVFDPHGATSRAS